MATSLTTGRPWRVILLFTVPLMIGNVVQQLYHFADTIVVGRLLGVDALAAVGATGSLLFLLLGFAWGLTSGFAIPTAQAYGAQDAAAVRRSVATGAVLSAITTVLLTVGAPLLAEPALVALRTPPELLADATIFTQISFLGAGALMFFNFLSAVIRAIGDSRTPLVFLVISCALNVVLVIAAVAWLGLGVAGAALATVLAQAVSVLLCLEFVRRRIPELHLRRDDWRITRDDVVSHLRLGLPMGFQASIIAIGALIVQVALNSIGADAVAAYTAASRVDGLAVALLQSMSLAVSMYVAQNYGAGRPDRIRKGVVQATWMAVGGAVALGILLISFGAPIVRVFIGDGADDVVHMAVSMLVINGVSYTALGVLFVTRGALQGLGNAVIPTVTGVVELFARAAAAIVLGATMGFVGVAWSNPLAWFGAAVILIPAYVRAHRMLATMPSAPMTITPTTPIAVLGPVDGSMTVETVVTQPVRLPQPTSRMHRALRRRPGASRRLARRR
ncbi:MATE family efflux transporter [Microbacterium sp. EYE_5]|uniref:MATE family efflux transporter n=1 Tax=unclassified Microbacterium TaxID=2609290 RepID=UPI002005D97C|nr:MULTISPECIES: MATE family efflux transporter [unclassified Microbacterium]MCK6079499.1 MATE family efflux transporter [Microbacterium sp. EYE_382]MCK6084769.1 MATE family efflux transporter [Microbacterium sp. EYE_384]MCK6123004.1 MATE family efflux transporter [Microbacterium sp. EYE_80]MCK6125533.1 MATE family efflux transporter [Microbacterium sp. EYE_79]MCK6140453.1 MATE family efflux transporter [Microbacterium sp. EYE_39]